MNEFIHVDVVLDLLTLAMTLALWFQINRQYQNLIALKCIMNNRDHQTARAVTQETADRIDETIRRHAPVTLRKGECCANGITEG